MSPAQKKQLADDIESAITTVRELADVIVDQRAHAQCAEGMQLKEQHLEAVAVAIKILSESSFGKFCSLMDAIGVEP